jgi:hypothetical protein
MAASQRTSIPAELRSLFPTHLRVGEITYDTRVPEGYELREPRLDETEVGEGTAITLIDAKQVPHWVRRETRRRSRSISIGCRGGEHST